MSQPALWPTGPLACLACVPLRTRCGPGGTVSPLSHAHLALTCGPQQAGARLVIPWEGDKRLRSPGRRPCFLRSDGYRSSKSTPSKKLGRQDALLPPLPLRVLLTPPAHEVGVGAAGLCRAGASGAEKLPDGGPSVSSRHDGCQQLGDCEDAAPHGSHLPRRVLRQVPGGAPSVTLGVGV